MYRITQLTGHDIYRIEVLKPWLFGHWGQPVWKLFYETVWGYEGTYKKLVEYETLAGAQEHIAKLKLDDNERLARSLGLWRVIWP